MKLSSLITSCQNSISKKKTVSKKEQLVKVGNNLDFSFDNPLFCQYQIEWIIDEVKIIIIEKSRQIGFSYTMAFIAVFYCVINERDFIYSSYNLDASKQFIRDCGKWGKLFNLSSKLFDTEVIEKDGVKIFEISFINGRTISAVSGSSVNLRGKPGANILIDEAAYREEPLEDILAAATATLIHGGRVWIGSTHCGVDSDFNQMIQKVLAKQLPYSHHKTTFKEAITQGLYKRIAKKEGIDATQETEEEFVNLIYSNYGIRAIEELDVIPSDFLGVDQIFNADSFQKVDTEHHITDYWDYYFFRYHDLATSTNDNAFFSASVAIAYNHKKQVFLITNYTLERLEALDGDDKIINLAKSDGNNVLQLVEQEPGASGEKYIAYMRRKFIEEGLYNTRAYKPGTDKVSRYIPTANACQAGKFFILDKPWTDTFINFLRKTQKKKVPGTSDLADCVSGIFSWVLDNQL